MLALALGIAGAYIIHTAIALCRRTRIWVGNLARAAGCPPPRPGPEWARAIAASDEALGWAVWAEGRMAVPAATIWAMAGGRTRIRIAVGDHTAVLRRKAGRTTAQYGDAPPRPAAGFDLAAAHLHIHRQ